MSNHAKRVEFRPVEFRPGQYVAVGSKIYSRCAQCGVVVCVNKWLLGSLHLCDPDEDNDAKECR